MTRKWSRELSRSWDCDAVIRLVSNRGEVEDKAGGGGGMDDK